MNKIVLPSAPDTDIGAWLTSDPSVVPPFLTVVRSRG
jgi:hypothetical protein